MTCNDLKLVFAVRKFHGQAGHKCTKANWCFRRSWQYCRGVDFKLALSGIKAITKSSCLPRRSFSKSWPLPKSRGRAVYQAPCYVGMLCVPNVITSAWIAVISTLSVCIPFINARHGLYPIHQCQTWFVTRSKKNTQYKRVYSKKVDKSKGILCDQKVRLTGTNALKDYPELIRRIKFIDGETGKRLVFLTNNMLVDAVTITQVYKNRWHVELFFKWIKQHLCIKRFFGRTDNAVRSQIWIAMCVYLLILIVKKRMGLDHSAYEILQILSISAFIKMPLLPLFLNDLTLFNNRYNHNQLLLFDL